MSGPEDVKLNEATPSETPNGNLGDIFMEVLVTSGIANIAKRGYRETAEKEVQGRTLVKAHFQSARYKACGRDRRKVVIREAGDQEYGPEAAHRHSINMND